MNTCPVYRRSGGHSYSTTVPGPIGSILAPNRDPKSHGDLPFACTLCGSCTDVCPVKIDIHHQLLTWRKELALKKIVPWTKRVSMAMAAAVFQRPWLYAFTMVSMHGASNAICRPLLARVSVINIERGKSLN
jgi:L-lactate dehydrogenase complex protein LldF